MGQGGFLKTDLDYLFSLSHLGSGTPDSAGTVTLIRYDLSSSRQGPYVCDCGVGVGGNGVGESASPVKGQMAHSLEILEGLGTESL